jgi:hypothetical protein
MVRAMTDEAPAAAIYAPTFQLVSRKRAAAMLDVSESFLEKQEQRGIGPPVYEIGGLVKYEVTELREWFRQHQRKKAA